jgi:oligoendopeptidase F
MLRPWPQIARKTARAHRPIDKLYAYDWGHNFNSGNPKPKGTPEEIVANGLKMYAELSAETKEFFDFMVKNDLLDLENKKGKAAGGLLHHVS